MDTGLFFFFREICQPKGRVHHRQNKNSLERDLERKWASFLLLGKMLSLGCQLCVCGGARLSPSVQMAAVSHRSRHRQIKRSTNNNDQWAHLLSLSLSIPLPRCFGVALICLTEPRSHRCHLCPTPGTSVGRKGQGKQMKSMSVVCSLASWTAADYLNFMNSASIYAHFCHCYRILNAQ